MRTISADHIKEIRASVRNSLMVTWSTVCWSKTHQPIHCKCGNKDYIISLAVNMRSLHIFVLLFLMFCQWYRIIFFHSIFRFLVTLSNDIEIIFNFRHTFMMECQVDKKEHIRHLLFVINQDLNGALYGEEIL